MLTHTGAQGGYATTGILARGQKVNQMGAEHKRLDEKFRQSSQEIMPEHDETENPQTGKARKQARLMEWDGVDPLN